MGLLSGLFGGGSDKTETVTKFQPNKFQKTIQEAIKPYLLEAAREGLPEVPQVFMGLSPTERLGLEFMKQAAYAQRPGMLSEGLSFLMGPALGMNPYVREAIDAATEPIFRRLTTDVLPQVRGQAVAAGGYGGSRQGIAEGLAAEGAQRAAANAAAQIALGSYQSGLESMVKGLGLAPTVFQAALMPAQQLMMAGAMEREAGERLTQEAAQREVANRMRNVGLAEELARIAFGMPGGGMAAIASVPTQGTNPVAAGLGGALSGAELAKMLGFSPGVGAGIGLLLGLL